MHPSPTVIILFDIDGTLLKVPGAGRRAINHAFLEMTGHGSVIDALDMRGMTDPSIVEWGFSAIGETPSRDRSAELLARYLDLLPEALASCGDGTVMPGVFELLGWLGAHLPNAARGLGTGNLEAAAYAKLEHVGLASQFAFGGFGSDARDRSTILRVGAERGKRRLGPSAEVAPIVVIGDTVLDVEAALAIGSSCIAVGTGGVPISDLQAAGASLAVETLEDPRVPAFLWSLGRKSQG